MAMDKRIRVGIDVETYINKNVLEELKNSLRNIQQEALSAKGNNTLTKELTSAAQEAKKLEIILNNSWNSKLGQLDLSKINNQIIQSYQSISKFKQTLESSGTTGANLYNQFANEVLKTNLRLKETNKTLDQMATTLKNTIRYGISSSIFNNFTNSIRKAYDFSIDLNTSLNNIRIVSNKSAEDMERFAIQANKAAQSLGKTTLDYTNASLIYYQQGLSDEEVQARTDVTLKAANVTGQTAKEVSEQLTAVWNGYNATIEKSEEYVDKLAAVAASTAADLEELSTGMSKVASAASVMGVPIDSLNAQLATIVSVTRQAPESVGTALRTIYARMGDIEAGLDDEVSLGGYTSEMKELGINVLDADGKLRNMGDVITEVGEKWSNMSREQQVALAQTMAGTRQYNNLLALFNNWDMYNEALDTSLNSVGELQRQQDIYMETTEAHLKILKTQAEEAYNTLFDTDTINGFLDALSGGMDILNDFLKSLGGGLNDIVYLGGLITNIFNKQFGESLAGSISNSKNKKENVASLQLMRDVAAEGISTGGIDQDVIEATQADIANMDELLAAQKGLTEEEFNRLNLLRQEIAEKNNLIQQTENLLNTDKAISTSIAELQKQYSDIKIDLENEIDNKNKILNLTEAIRKADRRTKEGSENFKRDTEDLAEQTSELILQNSIYKEITGASLNINQLTTIQNKLSEGKRLTTNQENLLLQEQSKIIFAIETKQKEIVATIKAKKVAEEGTLAQEYKELEILKQQFKEGTSKGKDIDYASESLKGISTLLMGIPSLFGAVNTALDENLSPWDKFSQIGSNLIITLPILIKNFNSIKNLIPNIAKSFGVADESLVGLAKAALSAQVPLFGLQIPIWGIIGALAALGVGIYAVYRALNAEAIAEKEEAERLKKLEETASNTKQSYLDLQNTIADYHSAKEGIEQLEKGTVEFTEAIIKANEEAQKLIDNFNLVAGKDYGIDINGQININEDTLNELSDKKLRDSYEAAGAASWGKIREAQKNQEKIVSNLAKEITELTSKKLDVEINDKNGFFDISRKILSGEGLNNNDIIKELQRLGVTGNDIKNSTDFIGEGQTSVINITDAIKNNLDDYRRYQQIENEYYSLLADQSIRAYATEEDLEFYNKDASEIQAKEIRDYVANAEQYNKESETTANYKQLNWFENWGLTYGNRQREGYSDVQRDWGFVGQVINQITGTVTHSVSSLISATTGWGGDTENDRRERKAREDYAARLGYKQNSAGEWLDSEGNVMDIYEKDLDTVISMLQSGVIENAKRLTSEFITGIKNSLSSSYEHGFTESESQNIADAFSVIQNKDISTLTIDNMGDISHQISSEAFDFSILTDEQREELIEQVNKYITDIDQDVKNTIIEGLKNTTFDQEALNIKNLKDYNDEIKNQATNLETTEGSLKLYARSMMRANALQGQESKELAKQAAAQYDFNRTFNEAVGIYDDNIDAVKDYIKADKNLEQVSYDVADAAGEVFDAVREMFDMDLSDDFIIDHFEDVQKILTGTEEEAENAYQKLEQLAYVDFLSNLLPQPEDLNLDQWTDQLTTWATELANLNPGEAISDSFRNAMIDVINNGNYTLEQVQEMFKNAQIEMPPVSDYTLSENTASSEATRTTHHYSGEIPYVRYDEKTSEPIVEKVPIEYQWDEWTDPVEQKYFTFNSQDVTLKKSNASSFGSGANVKKNFKTSQANNKAKSSGGSSKSEPKKIDKIDEEADRYHQIDTQITKVDNSLSKLESRQDRLFGADLIDNLNQQWELLNNQIDNYNEKLKIAQGEEAELRAELEKQGVAFNADGTIANYMQAFQAQENYVNGLIDQYNRLSAEQQEAWDEAGTVDKAKENFDKFKENMDRYDELVSDFIPGLQQSIQDAVDEQVDIQIQEFNYEIELRLDMAEAERDWNEFKKRVIDGIKDDDILGNARARLLDFSSYYKEDETGIIQANTRHVNDILEQIRQLNSTDLSNVYGEKGYQQALDDLKTYYEQLMEDLTSVLEIQEEIHQAYLDMMDEAQEKFDEQIDAFDTINDMLEHDKDLIRLVYGEAAYAELGQFYDQQEANNLQKLDFLRQEAEFWQNEMNNAEMGTDRWESAKEKWIAAQTAIKDATIESIETTRDKFLNTIDEIYQKLNNEVTNGLGLDYVSEQWDLINKKAEQYLDTVNSTWETQKLENKYLDAYDQTDSVAARRQIKAIMDGELKNLKERDHLTEQDIERANMRYELLLKEIALQEAQQNKSKMRLRRDSQGNYSYQFVADDDQVGSLQDEVGDLYNSLYNFDKQKYQDSLNSLYELWTEYQEKMKEAAQINDPQERAERELLIQQEYGALIDEANRQIEQNRVDLAESAFDDLSWMYENDAGNFEQMVGKESELYKNLMALNKGEFGKMSRSLQSYMNEVCLSWDDLTETEVDNILDQLVPAWTSGIQTLSDKIIGKGGFFPTVDESVKKLQAATDQYFVQINKNIKTGGQNINELKSGLDKAAEVLKKITPENAKLISQYETQLEEMGKVVKQLDTLISKYTQASKAAKKAAEDAKNAWVEQNKQAAAAAQADQSAKGNTTGGSNTQSSNSNKTTISTNKGPATGNGTPEVGDTVTFVSGSYYYDSQGSIPAGSRGHGLKATITKIANGAPYPIHLQSSNSAYGWVKKNQISGYDTGGYTGTWGNNGKLAVLHQKELVLNAADTENILAAVNIMRSLGSSMMSRLAAVSANTNTGVLDNTFEQNVHIDANFPNVSSSHEIENAINNLMNAASQRVGRR